MTIISLGDIPHYHAEHRKADAPALIYPNEQLSWRELDARVTRRARLFQSLGVRPGDYVTLGATNSPLFHEAALAIWKCGASPNVVSPKLPRHELKAILDLVQPKLVVSSGEPLDGFSCVAADADTTGLDETPFTGKAHKYWKAMTSGGSTGQPKVIVDHAPAEVDLDMPIYSAAMRMEAGMVVLNPGPLYHNAPFSFSHWALSIGCLLVGMERFDAEETLRLIERHKVNWVTLVPTMMHRIWSLPRAVRERYDLSSLKVVWHMAAPCPAWLKEAWIDWIGGEKVWELYGATERIGTTAIRGDEWLTKRGSVGRLINPTTLRILREDGGECGPGEVGELYFAVPETAAMPYHYIGAEAKEPEPGWQSVGDLGHVDEDGYIYLADRRTDLILRGGANVYPAEIEAAIDAFPQVDTSVVIGLPCPDLGQRVHAIVHPKPGETVEPATLHHFLAQRLTKYKLPESYEIAADPLRDDAGKVRRSALRAERMEWMEQARDFRVPASGL